jgi:hypothetical protein
MASLPPVTLMPTPTPNSPTESKQGTTLTGTSGAIIDSHGAKWTLVAVASNDNQVAVNGTVDTLTENVTTLLYFNRAIYQQNKAGGWWMKSDAAATWATSVDPRIALKQPTTLPASPIPAPITAPITDAVPGEWAPFSYQGMEYYILLPHQYATTHSYPLILFLHQGKYETQQPQQVDPWFNTAEFRRKYPCIVLLPTCSVNGRSSSSDSDINWGGVTEAPQETQKLAIALVEQTCSRYAVNLNKVYITGTAMGGLGTWGIITNPVYRKFFAAAMPLAGACYYHLSDVAKVADTLKAFPLWSIHGAHDDQVPIDFDRAFHKASMDVKGLARYSELVMGHDVWDTVYPAYVPYMDWLFAQVGSAAVLPGPLPVPTPTPTKTPTPTPTPAPTPTPTPPTFVESKDATTITTIGPRLTGKTGETWSLITSPQSGWQVVVNGKVDPLTANVVKLMYNDHKVYQQNKAGGWWSKTLARDSWLANPGPVIALPTPPATPIPTPIAIPTPILPPMQTPVTATPVPTPVPAPIPTHLTVETSLDQLSTVLQAALTNKADPANVGVLISQALALIPSMKAAVVTLKP